MHARSRYSPLQRAGRPTRKGAPVYRVESLRKEAFGFLGPIRAYVHAFPADTGLPLPCLDRVAGDVRVGSLPASRNAHLVASAMPIPRRITPICHILSAQVGRLKFTTFDWAVSSRRLRKAAFSDSRILYFRCSSAYSSSAIRKDCVIASC